MNAAAATPREAAIVRDHVREAMRGLGALALEQVATGGTAVDEHRR